jgi:hypothetical protein
MKGIKILITGLKEYIDSRKINEFQIPSTIARDANVVKSVNGEKPNKKGDVQIPEQIQADLNQNDPTARDYVKNRTHWVEEGEMTFVDSQTLENFQVMSGSIYSVQDAISINNISTDNPYKIIWDGQKYELQAVYDTSNKVTYIGNVNYVNMTSGGEIPFAIVFAGSSNHVVIDSTVSSTTSHTLSIIGHGRTIHKLDEKFLPENALIGRIGDGVYSTEFNSISNEASGDYSHAEGYVTTASGRSSHSEGENTIASGDYTHTEGYETEASYEGAHAEGEKTVSSGIASHAEGYKTVASGYFAHAEGDETTASGSSSHAEGSETKAIGSHSHAEGYGTTASSFTQHVQGRYNIADNNGGQEGYGTYAHIVGNGTGDGGWGTFRSNAHTLDWEGNAWYAGDVYVGSTSGTNKDEGSRKLIPSPTTLTTGSLLMYDGTDWVSITKEDLIEEIIAALPTWEGGSY